MTKLIEPRTLPGFRDFLPAEAKKRQWLKRKLEEIFESWGYDPVETPTLEFLELFTGQIGEDEKMFFKFQDPGGREVALRYDQTVPTVRVVAANQNLLTKPFKRYQIQSAFRAEKPQKGRYREFVQADADIFGDPSPYADAETIALSLDIYQKLGFKNAKVLINDRNLLKDFPYEALVSIDKIKKIGEEGVIKEMQNKGIDLKTASVYLRLIKELKPNETIKIILDYLKNYGFAENWFEFDPTITRSFAYSQGPIWEVEILGFTSGSVLGGERYDGLFTKLFGMEYFGTGFGLGFDRTLEAAEQFKLVPTAMSGQVLVTIFSKNLFNQSLKITKTLRENNINAETYSNPEMKLDKQLKYADQKGIPFAIIIGPEEVSKNLITLKNLVTKTQITATLDECVKSIIQSSL
ncbi:histidine--tRNA ligase [Candidatus Gottesmanbacteria bacterium]|nr:histidine--tRNA ligase [Candidatus Gottesmanbacteria bacterium]